MAPAAVLPRRFVKSHAMTPSGPSRSTTSSERGGDASGANRSRIGSSQLCKTSRYCVVPLVQALSQRSQTSRKIGAGASFRLSSPSAASYAPAASLPARTSDPIALLPQRSVNQLNLYATNGRYSLGNTPIRPDVFLVFPAVRGGGAHTWLRRSGRCFLPWRTSWTRASTARDVASCGARDTATLAHSSACSSSPASR